MKPIAEALGVGTMTLYGYHRNKDELLDDVAAELIGRVKVSEDGSPTERLVQLFVDLREVLAISAARRNLTENQRAVEYELRLLAEREGLEQVGALAAELAKVLLGGRLRADRSRGGRELAERDMRSPTSSSVEGYGPRYEK